MRGGVAVVLVVGLVVAGALPSVLASGGRRIVMPFGIDGREVPIIAGYELAPRPLPCDVGEPLPETVLYVNDFEGTTPPLAIRDAVQGLPFGARTNLFHETTFVGEGTDGGHSAPGRLYFGKETFGPNGEPLGSYSNRGTYVLGVASLPAMTLPAERAFLSWNEKFEVEALLGYDHMWIELRTPSDGEVYLLCSSDVESRPDPGKNESTSSACSPYRIGICPNGLNGGFGTDYAYDGIFDASVIPLAQLDANAPHWHARWVEIPAVFAGRVAEIRFSFDTADPTSNVHMGWMVDDVAVFTGATTSEPLAYVPPTLVPR